MTQVLMPKATAVWLVENTTLTFDQISAFTGLHPLEVQAIADGEVAGGMTGLDPTTNGQLTKDEIKRAEADQAARLKLSSSATATNARRCRTSIDLFTTPPALEPRRLLYQSWGNWY